MSMIGPSKSAVTDFDAVQVFPYTSRAVSVSVLRVAGGKHFPTDVLGGAALGTGIGWTVARLHPMTR